jgi:6-methylsalicylate decarboxylase
LDRHRIDIHAHYLAPPYVDALRAAERWLIGGLPVPEWKPELALEFMDRFGIARQFLSVSDPGVEFVPTRERAPLARACNDFVAGVIAAHPDRFGAFAVIPGDPAEALAEAGRALDELALDGVGLLSSYDGRYLGDPEFEPLLTDLNERGAWVFVHPTAVPADSKPDTPVPDFIAEYPFDTTRTIISLLINGTFARHRAIRWHFAHGGGTAPMLRARLNALAAAARELGPAFGAPDGARLLTASSAREALSRSFFDTALVADRPALLAMEAMAGSEHILFGSDWPFAARLYAGAADGDPQPGLRDAFSPPHLGAVESGNAARELIG